MQSYLLDTSVLIDFSKNHEPTKSELLKFIYNNEKLAICAISVTEFFTGLTPEERLVWDNVVDNLFYWDISITAAKKAGQYRYNFARKGVTLSTTDSLIAAVAWEYDATVITRNVKDFPMKDVRIISFQ